MYIQCILWGLFAQVCTVTARGLEIVGRTTKIYEYIKLPVLADEIGSYNNVQSTMYLDVSTTIDKQRKKTFQMYNLVGDLVNKNAVPRVPMYSSVDYIDNYSISRVEDLCIFYKDNEEVYIYYDNTIYIDPKIDKLTFIYSIVTCTVLQYSSRDTYRDILLKSVSKGYEVSQVNFVEINGALIKELYECSKLFFTASSIIAIWEEGENINIATQDISIK